MSAVCGSGESFFARQALGNPLSQDQVLRNHKVGSTWISFLFVLRFVTLRRIKRSVGVFFAYSTSTSVYSLLEKMPVSSNSYSKEKMFALRRPFSCTRSE